jgi:molecular chaperone HscB
MRLDSSDFELFGLLPVFALNRTDLDARWKALQGRVHPDRFAAQGAAAQRLSMQWSVRVNEAYRRLKDPIMRAAYLCQLRGSPIDPHSNTGMSTEFLIKQMAWREALDDARHQAAAGQGAQAVEDLAAEVAQQKADGLQKLAVLLDEQGDTQAAAAQVRALMFIQRFAVDVDDCLQGLGK